MVQVIILAGGKGTRMKSTQSKVLTPVRGVSMIERVLRAVTPICNRPGVIIGFGGEEVRKVVGDKVEYILQTEQLGTGHAVLQAREKFDRPDISEIVVLYGDHPLISEETVRSLIAAHASKPGTVITMATIRVPDFAGPWVIFERFGRILRNPQGEVCGIREWKDATEKEREIHEVNPGYYCFNAQWLWENIDSLKNENASYEYYLTDLVSLAVRDGKSIEAMFVKDPHEGMGVNTQEELVIAEQYAK